MRLLIAIGFIFFLWSCTSDKVTPVQIDCDEPSPTWDGEASDIVALTCAYAGCHVSGTSAPGNYTSYNGVLSALNNGSFRTRVFETSSPSLKMPPNYATRNTELTQEQLTILQCWMEGGYLEN